MLEKMIRYDGVSSFVKKVFINSLTTQHCQKRIVKTVRFFV